MTYKVAAGVEVLAAQENGKSEPRKNPRKGNRERVKEPDQQVASAKNTAYSGPSGTWGARNSSDQGTWKLMTSTPNNPLVGGRG